MGTRASVRFFEQRDTERKSPIVNVYHQYDGYISGVGRDLANFLKSKTIINGIGSESMEAGFANGMGCLAAQYVKESKVRIGGVYLSASDDEQEYNYNVFMEGDKLQIEVVGEGFKGSPDELLATE